MSEKKLCFLLSKLETDRRKYFACKVFTNVKILFLVRCILYYLKKCTALNEILQQKKSLDFVLLVHSESDLVVMVHKLKQLKNFQCNSSNNVTLKIQRRMRLALSDRA